MPTKGHPKTAEGINIHAIRPNSCKTGLKNHKEADYKHLNLLKL